MSGGCQFHRFAEMSNGAGGRTRTDMSVTSPDFESGAYTNFATPASVQGKDDKSSVADSQPRPTTAYRRRPTEDCRPEYRMITARL
jgi:hypothetical protein